MGVCVCEIKSRVWILQVADCLGPAVGGTALLVLLLHTAATKTLAFIPSQSPATVSCESYDEENAVRYHSIVRCDNSWKLTAGVSSLVFFLMEHLLKGALLLG
jgi:hypothetical protein